MIFLCPILPDNHRLWNGQVPIGCLKEYPLEPWRCYFGYRLYPHIKSPLFVFNWLFDEAQMAVSNVAVPVTKAQWSYIYKMGQDVKSTLNNAS